MKLIDVLHYYIGRQYVTYNNCGELNVKTLADVKHRLKVEYEKIELDLKPLAAMSAEDALELSKLDINQTLHSFIELRDMYEHGFSFFCGSAVEYDFTGFPTQIEDIRTVNYNRLSPEQFHYLISKGYDVFNLYNK